MEKYVRKLGCITTRLSDFSVDQKDQPMHRFSWRTTPARLLYIGIRNQFVKKEQVFKEHYLFYFMLMFMSIKQRNMHACIHFIVFFNVIKIFSSIQIKCATDNDDEINLTPLIQSTNNYVVKTNDTEFHINICRPLVPTQGLTCTHGSAACKVSVTAQGEYTNEIVSTFIWMKMLIVHIYVQFKYNDLDNIAPL